MTRLDSITDMIVKLADHMVHDDNAGIALMISPDGLVNVRAVQVSRLHVLASVVGLLNVAIEDLRTCDCGADHTLEIEHLRAAMAIVGSSRVVGPADGEAVH